MKFIKRLSVVFTVILAIILFLAVNCGKKYKKIQIILLSVDTLRGDHITPYGYKRDTAPNLARLVEDSTYYKNAYTNGCWTMPSHMSMITGTLPSRHGVNKDWLAFSRKKFPILPDSIPTLPQILKKAQENIKTVNFAKLSNELGFGRGVDINNSEDPFANDEKLDKLLKELENQKDNDFFFFLHTWMVHAPYTHGYYLKEEGKIDEEKQQNIDNFRELNKEERNRLLEQEGKGMGRDFIEYLRKNRIFNAGDVQALYDSGIRYVDHYIGKLLEKTKKLGIYDQLMIVIVSDHGEHFEEHVKNMFNDYHGHDYYEEFIKVPIIIKYPHQGKPKKPIDLASLIDVVPTILDYYGIKIPSYIQGESLLKPYSQRQRKYLVSEALTVPGIEKKMIRVGHLKYIVTMKKPDQPGRLNWDNVTERRLFDLDADPLEKKNLFKNKAFIAAGQGLEKMLKMILKGSASQFDSKEETTVNKEIIDHMKTLGYL